MLGKHPREEPDDLASSKKARSWQTPNLLPASAADHDQTLRFRASALTPVDSSDGEEDPDATKLGLPTNIQAHRPPALNFNPSTSSETMRSESLLADGDSMPPCPISARHRAGMQPSPIPHNLVNHSLNISSPTVSLGMEHRAPQPGTADQVANPNCMTSTRAILPPIRLPSPISDEIMDMSDTDKTSSDTDMIYHSPHSSSPAAVSHEARGFSAELAASSSQLHRPSGTAPRKVIMGYRADCDKCQRRVPGHFIHIRP